MQPFQLKTLSNADYQATHDAMLARTLERIEQKNSHNITPDELWLVEHNDVYTLGQAGKPEHILQRTDTPIIKTDRGGQVTWHGLGQLVVYFLFDLNTLGWGVRDLVSHAENAICATLNQYLPQPFTAKARKDAPGVYVYSQDALELGKIASLGFKIKHGFSYHGIAVNLTCDLTPFNMINPCGYAGMTMLRLADFVQMDEAMLTQSVTQALITQIAKRHEGEVELWFNIKTQNSNSKTTLLYLVKTILRHFWRYRYGKNHITTPYSPACR